MGGQFFQSVMMKPSTCSEARWLGKRWRERALIARRQFEYWYEYQYSWRDWLPPVWVAIARCESGKNPPNWKHNSGSYQGAYGFAVSTWDRYRLRGYPDDAYDATPREQYEVALVLYRLFGFSPWGCAGA